MSKYDSRTHGWKECLIYGIYYTSDFLAAIVYPIINPEDNLGMLDSDVCFYFDKVQELGRVKTPLTLVTQHDTIT